jgi:hypothetical protein
MTEASTTETGAGIARDIAATSDETVPVPSFEHDGEQGSGAPPLIAVGEIPVGIGLMIPWPGASPLLDALATANAAARANSLQRLGEWFPGYDFGAAAQDVDARRFAVIGLGDSLLDHLRGPAAVDRLLFDHAHHWGLGGISFSHGDVEGHVAPPPYARWRSFLDPQGWMMPGGLARALDERWTAIINSADQFEPALSQVIEDLSRVYACNVNTNIYISYGRSKGFGAHWDNHDTIIVPVRGAKRWALFEPVMLSAQRPWARPEISDKPLWEGVIEPGLALVIPRGWGHRVDGSDDLSIHYTIGVNRLETHEMIERVGFEAGFWPSMRSDVPYDVRAEAISYGGSLYDEPQGFARTLAEIATPEFVERAVAAYRARLVRHPFVPFAPTFRAVAFNDWDHVTIRLFPIAGVLVHSEADDGAILAFNNASVRVRGEALDAVVALADCEPWAVKDLPPVGEGEDRRPELARLLVTRNLAVVEPVAS